MPISKSDEAIILNPTVVAAQLSAHLPTKRHNRKAKKDFFRTRPMRIQDFTNRDLLCEYRSDLRHIVFLRRVPAFRRTSGTTSAIQQASAKSR
jgi:hypothetical protein